MSFLDSAQQQSKLTPPPSFEEVVGPAREQREKVGAQLEQSEKDLDTSTEGLHKAAENKPPEFDPVPPPEPTETDPKKIWGGAAMLLAAVGSAFTRRPMVTAMNAAANVINGYRQNDMEKTDLAFQSWKAANENAIKAHQFQIDQYKEALDIAKEDVTAGSAKMRALAAQFGDSYMLEASQTRSYQEMLDKYNAETEQLEKLKGSGNDLDYKHLLDQENFRSLKALTESKPYKNASPEQQHQMIMDFQSKAKKSDAAAMTEDITEPDPNANDILNATGIPIGAFYYLTGQAKNLPRDAASRKAAVNAAEEFAKTRDIDLATLPSQYEAYNKVLQFNIQRNNQTKVMEGEILGTLDNLKPMADQVSKGTIRLADVANLLAGKEVNDPNVVQYSLFLMQLRDELAGYSSALRGNVGQSGLQRSGTDEDRRVASAVIYNGMNSKAANGLSKAVTSQVEKMGRVLKQSEENARADVWDLFGAKYHSKTPSAPAVPQIPDTARKLLKEGIVTTFGNGQKWMLQNGEPVQVQ